MADISPNSDVFASVFQEGDCLIVAVKGEIDLQSSGLYGSAGRFEDDSR